MADIIIKIRLNTVIVTPPRNLINGREKKKKLLLHKFEYIFLGHFSNLCFLLVLHNFYLFSLQKVI